MSGLRVFSLYAFMFLTGATILYLSLRFNEFYWADQASSSDSPDVVMKGDTDAARSQGTDKAPMPDGGHPRIGMGRTSNHRSRTAPPITPDRQIRAITH
jgi:hypothetical protein